LLGFTHYTTRMLRNSAMPGSLTPRHSFIYESISVKPNLRSVVAKLTVARLLGEQQRHPMPRIVDVNASMPRVVDVNASMRRSVDVVARLVGPSDGRHSPVPSSEDESEDEPPNVAYLRATAGCRCAAAFLRRTPLQRTRSHLWHILMRHTRHAAHTRPPRSRNFLLNAARHRHHNHHHHHRRAPRP